VLNNDARPSERDGFRALVDRWFEAQSLGEMLQRDRGLWWDLERALQARFTPDGKGGKWSSNYPPRAPNTPEQWAIRWFALLLLNPLCEKLGGPCERCDCYYIKARSNQKKYCGGRCAGLASAKRYTVAQATAEREALVESAARFWPQWTERKHPIRSFWVAKRVNAARKKMKVNGRWKRVARTITQKWISRNKAAIESQPLKRKGKL